MIAVVADRHVRALDLVLAQGIGTPIADIGGRCQLRQDAATGVNMSWPGSVDHVDQPAQCRDMVAQGLPAGVVSPTHVVRRPAWTLLRLCT